MKNINHIKGKKFVIYTRNNLAMIIMTMELHLKNIIKSKVVVILLVNIEVLLTIFVI